MQTLTRFSMTSKLLMVVVGASALFACNKKEEQKTPTVRPAKIFTVGQSDANQIRTFPGEVQSTDKAIQSFRVGGKLIERPAVPGNRVKKGDVLAQLDPKDFKLKQDDSKAKFDLAKVQYLRTKDILAKGLIARADYDKAKSRFLAATADLKLATANLSYTVLVAPFDGIVSKVHVENFTNVKANEPVVNVQSLDSIDVVFQIPENIIARIKRGEGKKADIKIRINAHGDKTYPAWTKEFDTEADPQTQTFRAVVTMDRPTDVSLLEGMSTTVIIDFSKIFVKSSRKILLPAGAVFAAEDEPVDSKKRYVWIVDPDSMTVARQAITVGQLTNDGIEILSGIQIGQKIISAGVNFIQEGQKVKPLVRERGL